MAIFNSYVKLPEGKIGDDLSEDRPTGKETNLLINYVHPWFRNNPQYNG